MSVTATRAIESGPSAGGNRAHYSLPRSRGAVSEYLLSAFQRTPHQLRTPHIYSDEVLEDEDLQLALYCCYELHYQGLPGVCDGWEWEPSLIEVRLAIETVFEERLRSAFSGLPRFTSNEVPAALWDLSRSEGFSLSQWLLDHGSRFHAEEIAIHRSGYQLKEADPHTWAIPRLTGSAKAAMVTIQADEYGNGVAAEMHSSLFADAMAALGLDPTYGGYLDCLPAVTLATTNLISMFGLHRRLRGALVGHLASFEMNSVGPMARYSLWLERLGIPAYGRQFYDVHVEADEVHQFIACDEMVAGLLEIDPLQANAVMFGANSVALVESVFADYVVSAWLDGRTSLWNQ